MEHRIHSPSSLLPGQAHGDTIAPAADAQYRARAEQAAVRFEGLFISQMLQQMRKSASEIAGEDGLFQQRRNDMLDYADTLVADQLASQRAFGIANTLLLQLLPAAGPVASATPAALNVSHPPVALKP
jgi:flagellar protein FlgJ